MTKNSGKKKELQSLQSGRGLKEQSVNQCNVSLSKDNRRLLTHVIRPRFYFFANGKDALNVAPTCHLSKKESFEISSGCIAFFVSEATSTISILCPVNRYSRTYSVTISLLGFDNSQSKLKNLIWIVLKICSERQWYRLIIAKERKKERNWLSNVFSYMWLYYYFLLLCTTK